MCSRHVILNGGVISLKVNVYIHIYRCQHINKFDCLNVQMFVWYVIYREKCVIISKVLTLLTTMDMTFIFFCQPSYEPQRRKSLAKKSFDPVSIWGFQISIYHSYSSDVYLIWYLLVIYIFFLRNRRDVVTRAWYKMIKIALFFFWKFFWSIFVLFLFFVRQFVLLYCIVFWENYIPCFLIVVRSICPFVYRSMPGLHEYQPSVQTLRGEVWFLQ